MRRKQKGIRSLAELSVMPKTEVVAGDPGLRYNGLKRFQHEEAERDHRANLAKLDVIARTENDPTLSRICPIRLTEFDDPRQAQQSLIAAAERFYQRRRAEGIELNAQAQAFFNTVLLRNSELSWYDREPANEDNTWDAAWKYFVSLGALEKFGLAKPAPTKQVDHFEQLNGETREGRQEMKDAANLEFFHQARPFWESWKEQILRDYKVVMSNDTEKLAYNWFVQNNKSWTFKPNYDACRRYLVAIGAPRGLPKYCLTRDEMEINRIESDPESASDSFEAKLKFRQRRAQLLDEITLTHPEV